MSPAVKRSVRSRSRSSLAAAGAVTLVAAGATLGSIGPAAAAGNDSPPAPTQQTAGAGWIRTGQLVDGVVEADVRLSPVAGGKAVTIKDVEYGNLTDYTNVPTGTYTVALLPTGARSMGKAMVTATVDVQDGTAATVVVTGHEDRVRADVVPDDLSAPPAGQAKVRLISAVSDSTLQAQAVSGPLLAKALAVGSTTPYAAVDARTWTVRLTPSGGQFSMNTLVPVRAGGIYTMLALGTPDNLRLDAFRDTAISSVRTTPTKTTQTKTTQTQVTPKAGAKASKSQSPKQQAPKAQAPAASAPTGGVETGGGGLARQAAGQGAHPGGALGGTGLGLVVVAGGLLVAVRRRGDARS